MTAYVVAGLAQAKAAGSAGEARGHASSGAAWVAADFAKDPKLAADLRAYMQYALALAGRSRRQRARTSLRRNAPSSRRTAWRCSDWRWNRRKTRAPRRSPRALEQSAQQDEQQAWWPATRDEMLDFSDDVTPEATAYAVKFLSHQRPASALLPKAALWLMNHRNEGYWWSSTKQTAMVIYGLTDYLKATNELNPNLTATVYVNDKAVAHAQARSGHRPRHTGTDARRKQARSRRSITFASPRQARAASTIRRAPNITPPRTSCRRPAASRSTFCATTSSWCPRRTATRSSMTPCRSNGPVASGDILAVRLTVTGSRMEVPDGGGSHPRRHGIHRARRRLRAAKAGRRGGNTSSPAANCTTTAWPSSKPTSRRASNSISTC